MSFTKFLLCCSFLLSVLLFSCTSKPEEEGDNVSPTGSSADREELLINVADNIIIPAYALFDVKLDSLVSKSTAFTDAPSQATLDVLREAWEEAYIEWQKVELFDVGPANDHTLRFFVNIYPTSVSKINDNIAAASPVNLNADYYHDAQGFPAFDYLINGAAGTDQAILDLYTTAPDAAKRIAYLKRITTEINTRFDEVKGEWTAYRSDFISRKGTDVSSSLSLLVNGYVLNYETYIRSGKIGIPSGALVGWSQSPTKVESYYKKDLSLLLAKTAQQASVDFFNGKSVLTGIEGKSLRTYLELIGGIDKQSGSAIVPVLINQFAITEAALNSITGNLYDEVSPSSTQKIKDVYTSMQKTVRLLKADMTSAMSITITYVDNDGD